MDFLKYDLMVSNCNVQLDNQEVDPYSATTSASTPHTTFLELTSRALLIGHIMGDELMKTESEDMEKLKDDLESSSASSKASLSTNINLADINKDLELKLNQANAESIFSTRGARWLSRKTKMPTEGPMTFAER